MSGLILAQAIMATMTFTAIPQATASSSTARDLYIGCSLLAHGEELDIPLDLNRVPKPASAATCALETGYQLAFFSQKPEGFCPPKDASFVSNPGRVMAGAYIDWFERLGVRVASQNGRPAMLLALRSIWPCK